MIKNLITIVIILAFVVVVVFLDIPIVQGVLNSRKDIVSNQNLLSERENFIKTIESLIDKYKNNEEVLKNLDNILPGDSDVPDLLVQIEAMANAGGMVVKDVNITVVDDKEASKAAAARTGAVAQEKAPSNYKTISIDLTATGDYSALKKFLQAIEENMRLIDVDSISFSGKTQGSSSLFDFNITLMTYYYTN
jgi:Tfp pilus assembly protein PilO